MEFRYQKASSSSGNQILCTAQSIWLPCGKTTATKILCSVVYWSRKNVIGSPQILKLFFFFITCGCDNRVLIFLLILILWRGYFLLPDGMENSWNNFKRRGIQKSYHVDFQGVCCVLPRGGTFKILELLLTVIKKKKLNLSLDIKLTGQVRPVSDICFSLCFFFFFV